MFKNSSILLSNLFRIAFVLVFAARAGAEKIPTNHACHDLVSLTAGEDWRVYETPSGSARCFAIDAPSAGILTLDASVPAAAQAEARLVLVDKSCRPIRPWLRMPVLAQRAAHLALWTRAETHRFCVSAQDPRLGLGQLRILTAFLETDAPLSKSDSNPDDNGGEDEDPREVEIEPPAAPESEPPAAPESNKMWRHRPCPGGAADDHGDTFRCATPVTVGEAITGELGNPWGDDEDVFVLRVTVPTTLEVRTEGETDTFGRLDNSQGDRLAISDDNGADGNFRLVKTLMPGRYFVRVAGARWSEGGYRLLVTVAEDLR